jgi:DNA adenine methylase
MSSTIQARPFVKWIGGKRSVIDHLVNSMPNTFNRYYEPFVGGGALFFQEGYRLEKASISDVNPELINAYRVVAEKPEELIRALREHAKKNGKDYYYEVRASKPRSEVGRAARLLYLLKTCFNGLYRENSKGMFNASWGYYKNPDIVQEDNIRACSEALKGADIAHRPCWNIRPREGDLVYLDPPYHDSYTQYNADQFNEEDQVHLRNMALRLSRKGVYVMLSNSDNQFIRDLYSDPVFRIQVVYAKRTVSRDASKRGREGEVLITTYEV